MSDSVAMSTPRVSILIPNYNNGRSSSNAGDIDLIAGLLGSLFKTLKDDPTPLEIIAVDDGSTDDSLDTLRKAAAQTWRGGQPFITLIEREHCGVLSVVANQLVDACSGDILVRLDGDIQILTPDWVSKLMRAFDNGPDDLGVIGPKQLDAMGQVHSFGDFILHPMGYHHVAAGMPRFAVGRATEVDHVMGCFYCCRRAVHDELEGYDETILRGQTIDFGLRARLKGWRCWAIPQIEFVHLHHLRQHRSTKADTTNGIMQTIERFREKWGFCRISPDLAEVWDRYSDTPLCWNANVWGRPLDEVPPALNPDGTPLTLEHSQWATYTKNEKTRRWFDFYAGLTQEVAQQRDGAERVLIVEAGEGLLPHMIAKQGMKVVGTDRSRARIDLAQQCTQGQHAEDALSYVHQEDHRVLPLEDEQFDLIMLCEVLEKHPNPSGLITELSRVAKDGATLVASSSNGRSIPSHESVAAQPYQLGQMMLQINANLGWRTTSDPEQETPGQPAIVAAERKPRVEVQVNPLPTAANATTP